MKKTHFIAIVACCLMSAATSLHAQNGYDDTYHEIALSYGQAGNAQMTEFLGQLINSSTGVTYSNLEYSGTFAAEYLHHVIEDWFSLGIILSYGQSSMDFSTVDDVEVEGHMENQYYSLLPTVKFDWLRTSFFGLYSRLALGVDFRSWNKEYLDERPSEKGLSPFFTFQASLLGIELGLPHFRLFVEGGLGELGSVSGGLRFKF